LLSLRLQREQQQPQHRGAQQIERAEFTCNGVAMVRGPASSGLSPSTDQDSFVYDLYVREEDGESGIPRNHEDDSSRLAHAAELLEHISAAPTNAAVAGAHQWNDAYLSAADVPGIEFWDGSGDSSDELLDEAREFDAPSSEGSVDYPSTPEADAYVREVVSGDDAENGGGDDYAFGNEQFDSDDGDSNKAMCRPSPSTLFGYRRHGSDDDTLSMPEVNGLEQGDEGDSCPSD
jgi:hypothetical protein